MTYCNSVVEGRGVTVPQERTWNPKKRPLQVTVLLSLSAKRRSLSNKKPSVRSTINTERLSLAKLSSPK